jgi:hypothetical protein
MPASVYVYALLVAMAVAAGWAFINEARDHAADSATYKANLQTSEDNLNAAHNANERLERERASAERALALARSYAAAAQARYDARVHEVEDLARRNADVRTYLDASMPCALYHELRHDAAGPDQGECEEGAAAGLDLPADPGAGSTGAAQ